MRKQELGGHIFPIDCSSSVSVDASAFRENSCCFCAVVFRLQVETLSQKLQCESEERKYFLDKRLIAQMIAKHQSLEEGLE